MRTSFYHISSVTEETSFLKRKLSDILSVLGILLLFFAFTAAGYVVEEIVNFLAEHLPKETLNIIADTVTLILTTLLIALFYKMFLPMRVIMRHILMGALLTALLWLLMRPAFALFFSVNQSYGAVFGSMKNMFVSITWLYANFAVFLLGSVLIATLRKQDALLLNRFI
jgi:membrane protein